MQDISTAIASIDTMLTASQMRAARALLGIDQLELAKMAGLSLPTIQRMEASRGTVRGVVGTLVKVIQALEHAGIELIAENGNSKGAGRGVRFMHLTESGAPSRSIKRS